MNTAIVWAHVVFALVFGTLAVAHLGSWVGRLSAAIGG